VVQIPVPGVAYLYGEQVGGSGTVTLTPVYYSDFLTLFPAGGELTNVTQFRYAGQAMEIIPTVNAMTWTGSVQVYRGPMELSPVGASSTTIGLGLAGLAQVMNSSKPDAVHPFNMGCYCVSRQQQPDFPFHPVMPNTIFSEVPVYGVTGGFSVTTTGSTAFTGLGSMEAIVYKIPNYTATGNLFTLRTWATMELAVASNSALYEYAHMSPAYDPYALALARKAYNEIQLCVPFYENDGLWSKILAFIRSTSAALSFVPGPAGEIALGVNTIAEAINTLVV